MQPNRPLSFDFRLTLAAGFLLLALALAWRQDSNHPQPVSLTPSLTGQPEYCLTCHSNLPEISPSHPVAAFGCVLCHGGERLALTADLAHSSMRGGVNPSDLRVAEQSCGGSECHSGASATGRDHIQRVQTSIQSTYAGAITNVRYTFGAQPDQTPHFGSIDIRDLTSKTGITTLEAFNPGLESNPLLQKFGENCLTCHLNATPREGQPAYARQTGCAACHSPATQGEQHTLTTAIPYNQCNTCHNRGNYDLRTMTFVERSDQPSQRSDDYYQPIAEFTQCEYTLDCIDCHTRAEVMGDGDLHANQASIQYLQCKTCHGTQTEPPLTKTLTDPNDIAFRMAFLNPVIDLKLGDTIIVTEQGEPLWNVRQRSDGNFEMVGKASKQFFTFRPVMGTACEQNPQEQESQYCHKCHAIKR